MGSKRCSGHSVMVPPLRPAEQESTVEQAALGRD